jgi:hypothetical protein
VLVRGFDLQLEVQSSSELSAALKNAHSGDTIVLAAGNYSAVSLKDLHFLGEGVTITSADLSAPATLTDLTVTNSNGLFFNHLEFAVDPGKPKDSFKVVASQDVHFDSINWHGTLDDTPTSDQSGFLIRLSSNVSVTNSEFQQLSNGISYVESDHVTISGNNFHDIRTDGVHGGGTSFLTITSNLFTDFRPVGTYHPDAIQIWTTGTTNLTHDVLIADNLIIRGSGGIVQGIFLGDNTDHMPLTHVVITGNAVIGGMYNGIAVTGANDLQISGNQVIAFADQKSWIYVNKSTSVVVTDNEAYLTKFANTPDPIAYNNTVVAAVTDHGANALQSFLSGQQDGASSLPHAAFSLAQDLASAYASDVAVSEVPNAPTTFPVGIGDFFGGDYAGFGASSGYLFF